MMKLLSAAACGAALLLSTPARADTAPPLDDAVANAAADHQALVLEFGKPKRLITEPGLNYKIPFIQNVQFFDKRLLDLDSNIQQEPPGRK